MGFSPIELVFVIYITSIEFLNTNILSQFWTASRQKQRQNIFIYPNCNPSAEADGNAMFFLFFCVICEPSRHCTPFDQ